MHSQEHLAFAAHLFKEGKVFVAYIPSIDLSTMGKTAAKAIGNLQEALEEFIKTSEEMGTLEDILKEAGFERRKNTWKPPQFVSLDTLKVSLK